MRGEKGQKAGFRIGPGMASLLMILVTLLMAALAILAMAGAQNDATLSQRNLDMTRSYYQAAAQVQHELAQIDGKLLEARETAAGDLAVYEQLVREAGGPMLRVTAPVHNDIYLEALLRVPLTLSGPRYIVISHKLEDDASWDAEQDLDLYTED
ncbi:MAG: hypothetical protein FWD25_04445 [Clostridia bacterium]|nr:hypothetical protein [Clostridia bacterium]